jgi:hypothetical protein
MWRGRLRTPEQPIPPLMSLWELRQVDLTPGPSPTGEGSQTQSQSQTLL